jgi:hypothetical protein
MEFYSADIEMLVAEYPVDSWSSGDRDRMAYQKDGARDQFSDEQSPEYLHHLPNDRRNAFPKIRDCGLTESDSWYSELVIWTDYHTKFWEHGQLYVALFRVKSPVDLCILLPDDMDDFPIRPPVDLDVV